MNQDLMPFEAEAAKCEVQRAAERHEREAKAATKAIADSQREKRKAEEEAAKSHRRFARQVSRRNHRHRRASQARR